MSKITIMVVDDDPNIQQLINLYLTDCAKKELKPEMVWSTKGA